MISVNCSKSASRSARRGRGYDRCQTTTDQTLDLQRDALTKEGCFKIFTDTASGAQTERQGLTDALS